MRGRNDPMSGAKKKSERRLAQAQMGLSEREKQELKKEQAKRRNSILALVGGIVVAVLVVALLVWNSGVIERHATVLKFAPTGDNVGQDLSLTRADMDFFYYQAINTYRNQESSLYEQSGLEYTPSFDLSTSLKTQYIDAAQTMSYYDYFMSQALSDARYTVALSNAAKAEGYTLSEEAQASLDSAQTSLDSVVTQTGYGTRSNYLKAVYGRTMTEKVYFKNLERFLLAQDYYTSKVESLSSNYSDEEVQAYYDEHMDDLSLYDYDYAYFDGAAPSTTDADGNTVEPTDEENAAAWAAAQENAEAMLADLKSDPAADFSTTAQAHSGLASSRTGMAPSDFVNMPFADWLKAGADRADGDVELFELEGVGYYVAQYHGRTRNEAPSAADVRHILIATSRKDDPETADVDESQVPFTDEEIAAAQAEAQRILDEFTSGEQTGERFGELAEQYSQDRGEDGSLSSPGGLYAGVTPSTNFVPEFLDWIFTNGRAAGDTGIVQTDYGFHVMYLDAAEEPQWSAEAKSALLSADEEALLEDIDSRYELVVNHWYQVEEAQPSAEATESEAPEASPAN